MQEEKFVRSRPLGQPVHFNIMILQLKGAVMPRKQTTTTTKN